MIKIEQIPSQVDERLSQQGWAHVSTGVDPNDRDAIEGLFAQLEPVLSYLQPARDPEFSIISPMIAKKTFAGSEREMSFHTDNVYLDNPCKSVALFCIQQARKGGQNELVDGRAVLGNVSKSSRDTLKETCWTWQDPTTGQSSERFPVIGSDSESLRWWRMTLLVEDIGLLAIADELENEVNTSDSRQMVELQPGDVLVTDNTRILHNRQAFAGRRVMYRARFW